MRVHEGDRIIIVRQKLNEPVRYGEIIEVPHADGSPPYLVRWSDNDGATLIFPGPGAQIIHYQHDRMEKTG